MIGLGLLATLGAAKPASALEPAEPIRVELSAHPGCSTSSELLRAVLARTARARAAKAGEEARTIHVEISSDDAQSKLVGELSISDPTAPDQASEKRIISSDSCRELFDALALFAALAVDPQASTEPLKPEVEQSPSKPEPSPPSAPLRPTPRASQRRTLGASVGVEGGTFAADTAGLMLVAEPYLALSWGAPHGSGVAFSPLARLSFASAGGDTRETLDGPAHLHWTALRLGGCPLEFTILRGLSLRPCLELSGGALSATGKTIAHPESHTLSWASVGAAGRIEWHPHPLVEVAASLGAELPLKRDHFYFEPDTFAYQAPAVLGRALVGVGLHFL